MHHISRDKRAAQSAQLIYEGLLACLEEKPFDHVTVSDVQRASGVARSTFYRAFDNLSDVLYWKCDESFREALESCGTEMLRSELEAARPYFRYWADHSGILELLLRIDRQDIIYACHLRNAEALRQRYGDAPGAPQEHGDYFIAIRTSFTVGVLMAWIARGKRESADELVAIAEEQAALLASAGRADP